MYVCGTLLEGSLRDILVKIVLLQVKLRHANLKILKTENIDKNWNFREIFKIVFAVSVQNYEDIVESDTNMWKWQIIMRNYGWFAGMAIYYQIRVFCAISFGFRFKTI